MKVIIYGMLMIFTKIEAVGISIMTKIKDSS